MLLGIMALMWVGNYAGVHRAYFYIVLGAACWWMMLKSGVHPTLAGVGIAFTVPARPRLTSGNFLISAKRVIRSIEETVKPIDVMMVVLTKLM